MRASKQGILRIDQARNRKGWLKYQKDWYESAKVSISTLKRFLNRESINPNNFASLCKAVGIKDWQQLVDWNEEDNSEFSEKENRESNNPNSFSETIIKNRYKITKHLETKKNCETYLAQDLDLPDEPKCIVKRLPSKKMSEKEKMLFDREVNALYKLGSHDQIPSLLASFEKNNDYYLVEKYIDGQALSKELVKNEKWGDGEVIQFLEDVLETLQFIHQSGYVHRNINPNNLIRRESDQKLVFISFEEIKAIDKNISSIEKTSYKYSSKTTAYISPEQKNGTPNFHSDIYSIGMIAVQAVTNVHPKKLRTYHDTLDVIWRDLAEIKLDLKGILDDMICYDFKHRYQSVQEILDRLRQID